MASPAAVKREMLRDTLFPGAAERVWHRRTNQGFTTVPRLLSLVAQMIRTLAPKGDPSMVYIDLWTRAFDESMVTVNDEMECAFSSGYIGNRAIRTWRERMETLEKLGFIECRPIGSRKFGQVLILDPLRVCAELKERSPEKVSEEWWTAFITRAQEIRATIPGVNLNGDGLDYSDLAEASSTRESKVIDI